MIKHKKIIISLLLVYALFIVGIFNVHAMVYSTSVGYYGKTTTPMGYPNQRNVSLIRNAGSGNSMGVITYSFSSQYVVSCDTSTCLIVIPYTGVVTTTNYEYDEAYTVYLNDFSFTAQVCGPNYCSNGTIQDNNLEFVIPKNQILSSIDIIVNVAPVFGTNTSTSNFYFQTLGYWLIYNVYDTAKAQNDTAQNTKDINDSINDSSIDNNNTSSSTTSWGNKNASNGTITNLLTLPISLLQAIVNGIQSSCSSFSLGSLFGANINLPCINIGSLVGSALWTTIDLLFSGFMILAIGKKLIKIFNDFTNLKTNQVDELYGGGK